MGRRVEKLSSTQPPRLSGSFYFGDDIAKVRELLIGQWVGVYITGSSPSAGRMWYDAIPIVGQIARHERRGTAVRDIAEYIDASRVASMLVFKKGSTWHVNTGWGPARPIQALFVFADTTF